MTPICNPFPVDALPPALASYVKEGAAALGCDPSMIALPTSAVCGSLIGNTRTIRLKNSWTEPCVFWCCVVADSGTLKSPAFDLAVRPLHRLQSKLRAQHAERLRAWAEEYNAWSAAKARKEEVGDEPKAPPVPRVVCSDTTIEKLGEILSENPRGALCARDELAGWFGSFTRYKSGSTDLPQWLEMHRAGPLVIDRKTGENRSLFVDHAAVSVCGTIQPGIVAKAVSGDFFESGLVARLLLAMPPKQMKLWREVDIGPTTVEKFERLLERLHALDFGTNARGERVPVALSLDTDARRTWINFYEEWAEAQHDAEGEAAAALSKLEGYAARFALLHHVISRVGEGLGDTVPIRRESVESGISLCRWFANEAARVYSSFSETASERDQRRLIEYIASRENGATARDLQHDRKSRFPKVSDAEIALNDLVAAGVGHWEPAPDKERGRPASRRFRLNELNDKNQESDDIKRKPPEETDFCRFVVLSSASQEPSENDENDPDNDGHGDAYEPPANDENADGGEMFPFGFNLPANGDAENSFIPQVEAAAKPSRCATYRDDCECSECRCERATAQREQWPDRPPRVAVFSF